MFLSSWPVDGVLNSFSSVLLHHLDPSPASHSHTVCVCVCVCLSEHLFFLKPKQQKMPPSERRITPSIRSVGFSRLSHTEPLKESCDSFFTNIYFGRKIRQSVVHEMIRSEKGGSASGFSNLSLKI